MRTNVKRILALVLSLMMVVGMFAGCGQKAETENATPNAPVAEDNTPVPSEAEELEPVTLTWMSFGSEQEGTADVVEAVNELLATVLPNTTLELVFHNGNSEAYNMELAGGDTVDIAWEGYYTSLQNNMADGNLLALDELIANYAPNIAEEAVTYADMYAKGTWEGVQYAIPCLQPVANESMELQILKEWAPHFDLEAIAAEMQGNMKCTQKLLDLLDEGMTKVVEAGLFTPGEDIVKINTIDLPVKGYSLFNATTEIYVDTTVDNPAPLIKYEIPEFMMYAKMMASWNEKKYFSESQIVNQLPDGTPVGLYFNSTQNRNWSLADEHGIFESTNSADQEVISILANKPEDGFRGLLKVDPSNIVLPYTCEAPERAIMFLDLLHDDVGSVGNEIYNMLVYGFAKDSVQAEKYGWYNYELTEKDGAPFVDTSVMGEDYVSKHKINGWAMGNYYLAWNDGTTALNPANVAYCQSFFENVMPKMRTTPIDLMRVDLTPVSHITDAMKDIVAEQKTNFTYGIGGVEGVEKAAADALAIYETAGSAEVKEYLQEQIDNYIAANG